VRPGEYHPAPYPKFYLRKFAGKSFFIQLFFIDLLNCPVKISKFAIVQGEQSDQVTQYFIIVI
jgi:hypothetical protein